MLVVLIVLGILVGMIMPALQTAREAARRSACSNNVRQMAYAVTNFESQNGHFPPSFRFVASDASGNVNGWSAQALLLPYLEQSVVSDEIDYETSYKLAAPVRTADGRETKLSALRVPTYVCPSELRDEERMGSGSPPAAEHYPLNYGLNLGVWFVYDPADGSGGEGAFYPSSRLKASSVRDGMSFTLAISEVKAWQPYFRNAAKMDDLPVPATEEEICILGGDHKKNSGHTEWVDGRAHQIGFTTTFPPNTRVLCNTSGTTYDVDWTNWQEGKGFRPQVGTPATAKTYAAVTTRSYHPGGVNAASLDGSVRWYSDNVHPLVWRALSTRAGREIIPNDMTVHNGS
jgi:type II secretory pathway pseudopilin PulG